ncbi:hypothetical protein FDP41_011251 [Naegleria fowleri]|uniref:Uncharacterized protein n=1 Tax=Naegleria fowleri TaxID=5763 RepID=A0A6A5C5E9_NAEFO|nr:uncharacterized protein FDP41_011251 [Naegleria fowleri]KAF0982321.1 hypothetical protein FDP41_011251 [Naegleria fowleri]CAG4711925.1 unnamed protein product [Naegleria fowleri]
MQSSENVIITANDSQQSQQQQWTLEEHDQFLQGLKRYGTDWNKIQNLIPTKEKNDIREYAKEFFKMNKSAMNDLMECFDDDCHRNHSESFISTPEALASAFLTNPESVKQWQKETLEMNHTRRMNQTFVGSSSPSTEMTKFDKMNLISTPYSQQCDLLDLEAQTRTLDEEVELMKNSEEKQSLLESILKNIKERGDSCEKIENLIGSTEDEQNSEKRTNGGIHVHDHSSIPSNKPNFRNIYTFLGALFEPERYNVEELSEMLSPQEKEILQILMHNLAITLSTQQFQEEYSTYVHQLSQSSGTASGPPIMTQQQYQNFTQQLSSRGENSHTSSLQRNSPNQLPEEQ